MTIMKRRQRTNTNKEDTSTIGLSKYSAINDMCKQITYFVIM